MSAGHRQVDSEEKADYVFVNTCTVTAEADRKSHQLVNAAIRRDKHVAVMGCSPRVDSTRWSAHTTDEQKRIVVDDELSFLKRFDVDIDNLPFPLSNSRTRAPIAVQQGCDNICTFCITRIARGTHENISKERVLEEVKFAQDQGVREIVLTGINLAAWGAENSRRPEQARLQELLEHILGHSSIERIRLSSLGPQFIQSSFFDVYADERICDYLHISLQSGSDSVLERMIREHGTDEVRDIAEQARKARQSSCIAADIIAGFPAESEEEHQQTSAFIEEIGFAKLHVFPFSTRTGTKAAEMPGQLDNQLKKARAAELRKLGKQLREHFIQSQMGKEFNVLAEANGSGLSGNYIRIKTPQGSEGEITKLSLSRETLAERI